MAVTRRGLIWFLDKPAGMAGVKYKAAAIGNRRYIYVPAGEAGGVNGN